MFVGHSLLAFALAAGAAALWTGDHRRALAVGATAGAFATVPDVDMVYALAGLAGASGDALAYAEAFWSTGNVVHRGVTHSLVLALPVALAVGALTRGRTGVALALALGVAVLVAALSGLLAGGIALLFGVAALGVASVARSRAGLAPDVVVAAALVGLFTHPFGDLFTGEPPAMAYPLAIEVFSERVTLHPDPTLHLLGAFGVELAVAWLALAVVLRLRRTPPAIPDALDRGGANQRSPSRLRDVVGIRATVGLAYAASVLVIPAPTLSLSYPFVFSVLAVGAIGAMPRLRSSSGAGGVGDETSSGSADGFSGDTDARLGRIELPHPLVTVGTGLAAITLAGIAYVVAYLVV